MQPQNLQDSLQECMAFQVVQERHTASASKLSSYFFSQ